LTVPARLENVDQIKSLRAHSRSEDNREIFCTNREKNRRNREIQEIAE